MKGDREGVGVVTTQKRREKKMVGRADRHSAMWDRPHIEFSAFISAFSHLNDLIILLHLLSLFYWSHQCGKLFSVPVHLLSYFPSFTHTPTPVPPPPLS